MPIKRAAYKAIRSDKKKQLRNKTTVSRIRTLTKNLYECLTAKNKSDIDKAAKSLISAFDKAAQKGIIHRKTASRRIARVSQKVHSALKA